MVHSSLSRIGWVTGGAVALIQALMDLITKKGNIMMPAYSSDYSDPTYWSNPPVPKEWIEDIKENMPAFKKDITPTRGVNIPAFLLRSGVKIQII